MDSSAARHSRSVCAFTIKCKGHCDTQTRSPKKLRPGEHLRVNKRDAEFYFDQIRLPYELEPYFARPFVSREELLNAGLTTDELNSSLRDDATPDASGWHPVSKVWSMSFSWSSAVGQQNLLSICADAGLATEILVSPDDDVPLNMSLQFAVATDDVMIFSVDEHASSTAACALDTAMADAGVKRNERKDVNDCTNATCLGINLVDGLSWSAPAERIYSAVGELVELMDVPRCQPLAMRRYMGSLQWYDLLCRPKLSCYNKVYAFERLEPQKTITQVSDDVLDELLTSVALTPWWHVPLERSFAPFFLATDASTEFGFGGSIAEAEIDEVRNVSRLCTRSGDSVVLDDTAATTNDTAYRRHRLGPRRKHFKTVFSIRAKHKAHINLLEVGAINLGLEWMLRSRLRHGKRVVMLVDSKVAIGGAAKGRSNSLPLLRELRRTAALTMAGSLQPYYVYINTHDNPADAPSRGVHRCSREPKFVKKWRHHEQQQDRIIQRLRDCGHLRA